MKILLICFFCVFFNFSFAEEINDDAELNEILIENKNVIEMVRKAEDERLAVIAGNGDEKNSEKAHKTSDGNVISKTDPHSSNNNLWIILFIIALVYFLYKFIKNHYRKPKCPACGSRNSFIINERIINSERVKRAVKKIEHTKNSRGTSSKERYIKIDFEIGVVRSIYNCKACGNEFFKDSTYDVEI